MKNGHDLIAYATVHWRHRERYEARIEELLWWPTIKQFLCASRTQIRIIDYTQRTFHIQSVLRGDWSTVLIATNPSSFFLHSKASITNTMAIYTVHFQLTRMIDVTHHPYLAKTLGLCTTEDRLIALSTVLPSQSRIIQLKFFDWNLKEVNTLDLGIWSGSTEIRTDSKDLLSIKNGERKIHLVSLRTRHKICSIKLVKDCDRIAVLHNRRLAVAKNRSSLQIIHY